MVDQEIALCPMMIFFKTPQHQPAESAESSSDSAGYCAFQMKLPGYSREAFIERLHLKL